MLNNNIKYLYCVSKKLYELGQNAWYVIITIQLALGSAGNIEKTFGTPFRESKYLSRARFEPATYKDSVFDVCSPPLYQLSYREAWFPNL